jgi:aryl-alcohol dehydrogenase-like predicted oxidoreductase
MRAHPIDFIQVSYNVVDREADRRILPLAQERGIAVLVNRPFQEGRLTARLRRYSLPPLAKEAGAGSWAQFVLKYILGHPAVTCVIPATTRVDHVRENVAAAIGPLPDENLRRRMAAAVEAL